MKATSPPNTRFLSISATCLTLILVVSVLVMWIPIRWINPNLFQSSLFLLGSAWAVALIYRPFELRFSPVLIPLSATVAWGLFQLAARHTISRWETWMAVLTWLGNLVAFALALQVCGSSRIRRSFLRGLLYFAFALSVVSVVQYFSSQGKVFWFYQTDGDALGPFLNRDRYAAFIELVLPLALVEAVSEGGLSLRFTLMGAAMFASVIAGASRAGAILTVSEIIAVLLIAWIKGHVSRPSLQVTAIKFWFLAILFTAVVGWVVLWNRFKDPDPFKGRREILASAIHMTREKPYFGFGLGNFVNAYPAYAVVDMEGTVVDHAHNDWAEWAADGGIPFALMLLYVAIWSVPAVVKAPWGIGVIAVFVHSLVDYSMQAPVLELWLFTLMGAIGAATVTQSPLRHTAVD